MTDDAARKDKIDDQEERKVLPQDGREGPVDPYTGEVEPPAPDAYKVTEIVPTDPDNREGENFLMDEEDSLDKFILDSNADEIAQQVNHFTEDEEILDDFADRQGLAASGRQKLEKKLNEHNGMDPSLSGGDLDAAWEDSIQVGEESVGGSVSTPDHDIVDEIGEAAGLNYKDNEELDYDKRSWTATATAGNWIRLLLKTTKMRMKTMSWTLNSVHNKTSRRNTSCGAFCFIWQASQIA